METAVPGTPGVIGIIGGSGLYDIEGLHDARWTAVETPWGRPSDELLTGDLDGQKLVFLPRHGRGHRLSPSDLNSRANIDALKRAGATDIISLSACGSLREDLPPGTFVIVDQFIDRTFARVKSACRDLAIPSVSGGTYLVMEGPQFSTLAESNLYRSWGCDVIGMTNMPEAKLAREAELCYATVAMVTDWDCWHPEHDHVSVEAIIKVLLENAAKARGLVRAVTPKLAGRTHACPQGCHTSLAHALITAPAARDPALVAKLDVVAGRVLG